LSFLDIVFCREKFLIRMKSSLSMISFIDCAFFVFKKHGHIQGYLGFLMLTSKNFIILGYI
jgi:hypothetical protein